MASTVCTVLCGSSRSVSPCTGGATQHLHGGDGRLIADDDGHTGFQPMILGIADLEATDIGNRIAGAPVRIMGFPK
jgi:hypothetical protein